MRVRPDYRSSECDDGRHYECGHRLGNMGHLFRKMETPMITLCQCDCHVQCPIASDQGVPETDWYERCVCPGAEESKHQHRAWDEERAAQKRAAAEIRASIDPTGKSRAEIRAELEAAYQERGMNPSPYELEATSGSMEAAGGPAHLAGPRVMGTLGRLVSNLIRDIRKSEDT
jgi:hypothetical protein